jgi:hypothetical protein
MRYLLERVSQPELEPITLAEMKRHLRIFEDMTDEHDDINALITASRQWVEQYTGRALVDQQWQLTFGDNLLFDTVSTPAMRGVMPSPSNINGVMLRRSPVLSVVSMHSVDNAGVATLIDPSTYVLEGAGTRWPRVAMVSGPMSATGTRRIVFRAGYVNMDTSPPQSLDAIPRTLVLAMKLWAASMYDRDQWTMELIQRAAENLARIERVDLQVA